MRVFCSTLLLATLSLGTGAQTLYKSVDANGKVVYSDRPPAANTKTETLSQEQLPVSIVPGMAATPKDGASPKTALPPGQTVLYMAQWCGYCRLARGYLAKNKIPYREVDIDTPTGKAAFANIGGKGIPVLLANGQRLTGFRESSYDALFAQRSAKKSSQ